MSEGAKSGESGGGSNGVHLQPDEAWTPALPEQVPGPSLWPPALGLAVTLVCWGLASTVAITVLGFLLFVVAIAGWVQEIRHDRQS